MIAVREEDAPPAPDVLHRRSALLRADSRMRRLFDVTHLSSSLPVYETREEARAG